MSNPSPSTEERLDVFDTDVREYRAARRMLNALRSGELETEVAVSVREVADRLGAKVYTLSIQCMLCPRTVEHETTIEHYAELLGSPRAICEKH